MEKKIKMMLTTVAVALATGCATAGTWVNGCYINGPLCTVCDGRKVVAHTYGTTICTHCDGTGIEPPEETVVANTVIVDTWCPPPPPPPHPPRWHRHRPVNRPVCRPNPPPPRGGRPPQRSVRPPARRPAPQPARPSRPASGGGHRGGGSRGGRR